MIPELLNCGKTSYNSLVQSVFLKMHDLLDSQAFDFDLDESDGVISYKVKNIGNYVINKQPPLKQIWSSSPITGPKRFNIRKDYNWYEVKENKELLKYIKEEIEKIKDKINVQKVD